MSHRGQISVKSQVKLTHCLNNMDGSMNKGKITKQVMGPEVKEIAVISPF
jgi:hypothetical protein